MLNKGVSCTICVATQIVLVLPNVIAFRVRRTQNSLRFELDFGNSGRAHVVQ